MCIVYYYIMYILCQVKNVVVKLNIFCVLLQEFRDVYEVGFQLFVIPHQKYL